VIAGQLEFDMAAAMQDSLLDRLRAAVTEPGMTEEEITAAVEDARHRLGLGAIEASPGRRCICEQGALLFVDALAVDRRCARCGREPRG
jgi:hypothetical protein